MDTLTPQGLQRQEKPSRVREHSTGQEGGSRDRRAEGQQAGVTPCPSKAGGSLQPLQLFPATEDEQPSLTTTAQTLFLTRGKWLFAPEQHQFIGGKSTERGEMPFLSTPAPTEAPLGAASTQPHTAAPLAQLVPWHSWYQACTLPFSNLPFCYTQK